MWFLILQLLSGSKSQRLHFFPLSVVRWTERENRLLPGQLPSLTGRHFRGEVFSATKKRIFPILIADIAANVAFRQQTRLFRDKRNQSTKYSERNPHLLPEPGRRVGMHSCVFPHLHVFPQAAFIREDSNHSDCMENPERSKSKREMVKKEVKSESGEMKKQQQGWIETSTGKLDGRKNKALKQLHFNANVRRELFSNWRF